MKQPLKIKDITSAAIPDFQESHLMNFFSSPSRCQ